METHAPVPVLPPHVARAFRARVLDPAVAPRNTRDARAALDGEMPALQPTAYLTDSLLVRGLPGGRAGEARARIAEAARALDVEVGEFSPADHDAGEAAQDWEATDQTWTSRLSLAPGRPLDGGVDAWTLLQHVLEEDPALAESVSLNHVMAMTGAGYGAASGMWGYVSGMWGYVSGMWGYVSGMWGYVGGGLSEYGPGFGGRTPVAFCSPDPRTLVGVPDDAPVVAILDTGLGRHPWFIDASGTPLPGVLINPVLPGGRAGLTFAAADDPEGAGVVSDPLNGGLDAAAGHGTFVAGIVRQRCPQATIMAIPVLDASGHAEEHVVLTALGRLVEARRAADRGKREHRVDIVNLSMGYYHESPGLPGSGGPLEAALTALTALGVEVVSAAGNDATTAPFLPAALADRIQGLHSVGALNPDGRTVALFSNGGAWVREHAVGAAVVSTVPTTLAGSAGASVLSRDPSQPVHPERATIDPDTHVSGFALWSGTSFAAPHIAGDLATRLLRG